MSLLHRLCLSCLFLSFALSAFAQTISATPNWTTNPFDFKLFVENRGQFDKDVPNGAPILYEAKLGKVDACFTSQGLTYRYQKTDGPKHKEEKEKAEREGKKETEKPEISYVNLIWVGANPNTQIEAAEAENYYYTYPVGLNRTIQANVYRKITYHNLYPGIDVEYGFPKDKDGIKYNVIVHPGADVSKVKLKYGAVNSINVNGQGDAVVKTLMGEFTDHAPVCYYREGGSVMGAYSIPGGVESFAFNGKLDGSKTLIIDPWTTNPLFTGGYNSAYEVDYDNAGNVYTYGGWGPSQLVKLNSAGVIQWRFNCVTINTDVSAQWGDFVVDKNSGTSYIIEGYNPAAAGGARSLKVNTAGALVTTFAGNTNMEEFDRVVMNDCTHQLVIGGGGTNATNQGCMLDTTMTGFVPHNVLGANLPYHDMWLLAMDPSGATCYMGSTNSCCNNNVAYDDRLLNLNVPALTAATFNNNINADTYMPEALSNLLYMTWSGTPANGFNGLQATKNALYLWDGADLFKFNKNTGALNVHRAGISTAVQSWGGLDVDICDNVYLGHNSIIGIYNGAALAAGSNPTSTIAVSNTIYDLMLGKNYQTLYASGEGFVSSFNIASPPVTISKVVTQPACGGPCNGAITANLTTCGAIDTIGATYLWSTGATTHTITGLCAGTYSVTIIPSGMCKTFSDTVAIVVGGGPTVTVTPTTLNCTLTSSTISASSPTGITYVWSGPGIVSGGGTSTPTVNAAGTYNVTVTDAGGCSTTASVSVSSNTTQPNLTANSPVSLPCTGNGAVVASSTTSGATFQWSGPGIVSGGSTSTATINAAGGYTVTVTDPSNGCTSTAAVTVNAASNLTLSPTSSGTSCGNNNGTAGITVTAGTGPFTYSWTGGATSQNLSNLGSGTYNVTVTGAGGCSATASVSISASTGLSLTPSSNATTCGNNNGSVNVNVTAGTGPFTYAWTGGATTQNISNLASGIYTVTVTGAGGCTATSSATISASTAITVSTNTTAAGCISNGSASVNINTGTGPFTYQWTGGGTNATISNLSAGNYNVTVTGAGGCTATATAAVASSGSGVTLSPSTTDASCGNSNGSAGVSVTTGTAPFTYSWNTGATTSSISNVAGGTYTITVTGSGGCTATATINVNSTTAVTLAPTTNSTTCGNANGSASVNVTVGTGPFTYSWTGGATTQNISNLASGTYNVTVTGAGNCTATATATVASSSPLAVTPTTVPTSCGNNNGSATVTVTVGTSPYTYTWNTGATTATISNLAAGTYNFTATDVNGCSATGSVIIISSGGLIVNLGNDTSVCLPDTITLNATTAGATYLWSNGATSATTIAYQTAEYYVTVTSGGCTGHDSIHLTENPKPPASVTANQTIFCSGDSAQICATAGMVSYIWNTGATTTCIITQLAGNYYVTLTDANGCSAASNHLSISVLTPPPVSVSVNGDTLTSYNATTYQWYLNGNLIPGATNQTYIATVPGSYTVEVTDTNGCATFSTAVVITGINDLSAGGEFSVYPNPNSVGGWQLTVGNNLIGSRFEIFDAEGRLVLISNIENRISNIEFNAASGIYLLRIVSEKKVVTEKLIKL